MESKTGLLLSALGAAATLAGSPAYACEQRLDAPPPPRIYWSQPPLVVESGEVVLEVEFSRFGSKRDVDGNIVVDCGPFPNIYRIVQSLAGNAPSIGEVIIETFNPFDRSGRIVVGRLVPPQTTGAGDAASTGGSTQFHTLKPRPPPQ